MKIQEITANEHRLLRVKVDKKIPFQKIQRALKSAYNIDISRGRLSEMFAGISPMDKDLENKLCTLLLDNDEKEKHQEVPNKFNEKTRDQGTKVKSPVPPYAPHYSLYR